MSERYPNPMSIHHRRGERDVKATIRNSNGEYQYVGREEDPRVAEAMAYAAKYAIDSALKTMNDGEPNGLMATASGQFNAAPGVTEDFGGKSYTTSYKELEERVRQGHRAASEVQAGYYERVAQAKAEAKAIEKQAIDNL